MPADNKRSRSFAENGLPTLARGMNWSDPQYVKVAKTTYTVVKTRPRR